MNKRQIAAALRRAAEHALDLEGSEYSCIIINHATDYQAEGLTNRYQELFHPPEEHFLEVWPKGPADEAGWFLGHPWFETICEDDEDVPMANQEVRCLAILLLREMVLSGDVGTNGEVTS